MKFPWDVLPYLGSAEIIVQKVSDPITGDDYDRLWWKVVNPDFKY